MKKLCELLVGFECTTINCDLDIEIFGLSHDSRSVKDGYAFFALPGENQDGRDFAFHAMMRGARVIITEQQIDKGYPQVLTKCARTAMSLMAKAFYNNACDNLKVVGITGTNGKTTTTHILTHILRMGGVNTASIGTLGIGVDYETSKRLDPSIFEMSCLTTPDPIELHRLFYDLHSIGIKAIVMEASAHAIHLKKLVGITFDVGIFTNLSIDHLDFFQCYRKYADTKINWFQNETMKRAIINIDDIEGKKIQANHDDVIAYSLKDVHIELSSKGSRFTMKNKTFDFPLAGAFNVYNALAAIKSARLFGIRYEKIIDSLKNLPPVPGRFNTIDVNGVTVVIDYAHTPDGLEKIITSCREIVSGKGRLITVFGCGGNRDATKRPLMGSASAKLADFTIITSDNPRDENPRVIMLQIEAGVKLYTTSYCLVESRRQAIAHALKMAKPGDVVIVAGKGAENYQEIKGKKIPYNDHGVINNLMDKRQKSTKTK
ncbi:MAG: UDP-N-acetylmuramoyl-L-alanyl-D-glutamate--2,6-diaminopimelate ligase [Firmicutes bacterium]|nr:UDP-N-acetylmuramoyl-L-alanyl-D-glutamate--2,6-diaminopimelate ligase [Bacillota bacterium]